MQIIKELKDRWRSESPEFFIKLQKLSIRLGISAVSILGAEKLLIQMNFHSMSLQGTVKSIQFSLT